MVSEVLSRMISKAEMRFISGFKVGSREVSVSHLQFANDTMIFCDANIRQLGYLRCIHRRFEAVSGLKINIVKSEIFQVGENCDMESLAWILGCNIGTLPALYLGLPLRANYKSKVLWEPVLERISSRLESWKTHLLSKGGRLTLIKATLAAMLNYFLSLFMIPASIAHKMEAMFTKFVWDDRPKHHRYHLVDWDS